MDEYNISTINESRNEFCIRLINILTPCIIEGFKSIYNEAYDLAISTDSEDKYLMTYQNLLINIPRWNDDIVDNEVKRISESSGCNYISDLLTCVHITHLKSLTCIRPGLKQKKINIDIPNINNFIHKVYINIARKLYVNIYLFEKDIAPLLIQKNNREFELIIKECISNTIRDNIPVENILQLYLDETVETDIQVEEKKEVLPDKEEIIKLEKQNLNNSLEDIKKELKEELKKEKDENLKNSIKNINKTMNQDNEDDNDKDIIQDSIQDSKMETNKSTITIKTDKTDKIDKTEIHSNEIDIDDLIFDNINKQSDSDIINLNISDAITDDETDTEDVNIDNKNVNSKDIDSFDLDIEELK